MKRKTQHKQRNLFEFDQPEPRLPPDQKAELLPLIRALLLEAMILKVGGEIIHEQDHA